MLNKYKLGFLGLMLLLGLGSSSLALADTTVIYNSPTSAIFTSDQYTRWGYQESGSWQAYSGCIAPNTPTVLNNSSVPMLGDNATSPIQVMGWGLACSDHSSNTADPSFDGFSYLEIPYSGGYFTGYVAPIQDNTGGIGLFKTGVGSYTATSMIGQTATALSSTIGLNGLGSIIAVIGGMILAFGVILWVVSTFKEVEKKKKI